MDGTSTEFTYQPASANLLATWHYMMRRSMAKANKSAKDWDERSEMVNAWCDSQGYTKKQRTAYRMADTDLRDHFSSYSYFSGEVNRFGLMIQAEVNMRKLMEGTNDL